MEEVQNHISLFPELLLKQDKQKKLPVIQLKHPKTGTTVLCTIDFQKRLYEFVHFKEEFSSWFADDSVIEDGSLYMLSAVDPLFFLLPYFNQHGKYCPLEDLIVDEDYHDTHCLLKCCIAKELSNIADSKESMGITVYNYNRSKSLNWLRTKVQHVASVLKRKNVNISDGSHALSLNVTKKPEEESKEKYCQIACHLVSEYLTDELSEELFTSLGLPSKKCAENFPMDGENIQPQAQTKRLKTEESVSPIDDYSTKLSMGSSQTKQKSKLSVAQKQLMKVDKSGMKNISSFFQKK